MGKQSSAWKDLENAVADILNGERIKRGDDFGEKKLDVEHKFFSIDCKHRTTLALWGWYTKLVSDTKIIYKGQTKIPILAVKKKGQRGILVVIKMEDFINIMNRKDIYDYVKGDYDGGIDEK